MVRVRPTTDKSPRGHLQGVTPQKKQEIRQVLEQFSVNNTVDAQAFKSAATALDFEIAEEEINRIISELSQDGTGKIDIDQLTLVMASKFRDKSPEDELLKAFRVIDQDKNGKLSFADIQRISRELGINFTEKEIQDMVSEADRDHDGEVNAEEFMKMMSRTAYTC